MVDPRPAAGIHICDFQTNWPLTFNAIMVALVVRKRTLKFVGDLKLKQILVLLGIFWGNFQPYLELTNVV